jgi:uncharacterized protein (DUF1778 family)
MRFNGFYMKTKIVKAQHSDITEAKSLVLSEDDGEKLFQLLKHPPEPNVALRGLLRDDVS